jgi:general secretion pathway protein N
MDKRPKIIGLALLACLALAAGSAKSHAATSATLDILPDDGPGRIADSVDVGNLKPLAGLNRDGGKPALRGNPLWSVPLSVLTATQERPIFSTSRRPAQRAMVAPLVEPADVPLVQKPTGTEHPPMALIGAVVGDNDAIAVFIDRTSQKTIRLRQGETHAGWVLNSVLRREVTLSKAELTETLVLLRQDNPPGAPATSTTPLMPAAGGADGSYTPFAPQATPKNGEPDGL